MRIVWPRVLLLFGLIVSIPEIPAIGGEPIQVVATVPELASLAEIIGGDRVQVASLCRGYQDPHYLEAKPSYARILRDADLLILVGKELEVAWLPRLLETARNPDLRPGSGRVLEAASTVARILEIPSETGDRSQGDIHPYGNPHILLDPRNGKAVAAKITEVLAGLDPQGKLDYETRYQVFADKLDARIRKWENQAAPLRGTVVVAYHKQWEYLADWLGLEILGYIENRPGIPPSPRHVKTLLDQMKKRGARLVLAATFVDIDAAGDVSRRADAQPVVLPASVGGVEEADDFFSWFDVLINRLVGASS